MKTITQIVGISWADAYNEQVPDDTEVFYGTLANHDADHSPTVFTSHARRFAAMGEWSDLVLALETRIHRRPLNSDHRSAIEVARRDSDPGSRFGEADIDRVAMISEGANDEQSWLLAGQLKNSSYFVVESWCDYTGWG